jgi:predicted enzyme related to lactoylglutathione lyase
MATGKSSNGVKTRFTGLKNSPVVMVWRRVTDLEQAANFADKVAGWPRIGGNDYANIYDAGTTVVGYWVQDLFNKVVAKEQGVKVEELKAAALQEVVASCCELNFSQFALVSNPATEILLAPTTFQTTVQSLSKAFKLSPTIAQAKAGETLSFVDQDGNFSGFFRPGKSALTGDTGLRLKSLMTRLPRGGAKRRASKTSSQFVGFNILVSDLKRSQKYYKEVLGLKSLKAGKGEAKFDLGTMILSIRQEPAIGLVQSLARTGRLLGDWIMFHVNDIESAVEVLEKKGVEFPLGIEESGHGLGAFFKDPDGHSLTLWQPPNQPLDIDYFPVLQRVLSDAAQAK